MNNRISKTTIFLAAAGLVLGIASAAFAGALSSFEEAKQVAQQRDLPVMLKLGTGECGSCQEFDEAAASDPAMKSALSENVVLCVMEGKGKGAGVAKRYNVHGFPVFILTNSSGEVIDRWNKWKGPDDFVKTMTAALTDPTSVNEKMQRFAENATEADALKLAELRAYDGLYGDAVAYLRRASELAGGSDAYQGRIFGAMAKGVWSGLYTTDDVKAQADAVFASSDRTPDDMFDVVYGLKKTGYKAGEKGLHLSYLKTTVEQTEGVGDQDVQKRRAKLLPDYALHIEKNEKRAVAYHKEILPEDWRENANMLNNFAWWCFENEINLDEAEDCARQGIEMAKAGREKANILDTLAEICNVKGDCGDAVKYIQLAIKEDPENEYFRNQEERFTKLLAQMEK